jgi:response regulator NasT
VAHKGRVLVVDDDRLVLATLSHGLSEAGYDVVDADNGDEAILLARQHRPDLALLDIRMEGLSGFDVAATLRDQYQIPFMFLSAFCDEATAVQVRELGAVAYLVKPLDIRQIVPVVDTAIASAQARRADRGTSAEPAAGAARGAAAPADAAAVLEPIAMAVGVLMHRFSLSRAEAHARLRSLAAAEPRPLAEQAERVLAAVELLSMSPRG